MSAYLTGLVLKLHDVIAHQSDALVLITLTDWANDQGDVIYSRGPVRVADIAARARLSIRGVQGVLARLEEQGLLVIVRSTGGRGKASQYRVCVDLLETLAEHTETAQTPQHAASNPRTDCAATASNTAPDAGPKKEEHPTQRNPTGGSRARDLARPGMDLDPEVWEKACRCADLVEQARHPEPVVEPGGECRALAFAMLADYWDDRGRRDPWSTIVDTVEQLASTSDDQLLTILADLRHYPDGAYPDTEHEGHIPSRIEKATRRIQSLRAGRGGFKRAGFGMGVG